MVSVAFFVSVVMLDVVMLSVILLSVMAPKQLLLLLSHWHDSAESSQQDSLLPKANINCIKNNWI